MYRGGSGSEAAKDERELGKMGLVLAELKNRIVELKKIKCFTLTLGG